jgi:hypothetical protein
MRASLVDADFTNVSNVETLQLTHSGGTAQSVTLDAAGAMAAGLNYGECLGRHRQQCVVTVECLGLRQYPGHRPPVRATTSSPSAAAPTWSVTGAGSDTVNGALSTGDTIDLGADNDIFDYRVTAASNFVDGGGGHG